MEICEQDKSILMDFQQDDTLFVEWCDGLTRGGRELYAPNCRTQIRTLMETALHAEPYKGSHTEESVGLRIEVEHGVGYFCITLSYVPEEDLLPWQWLTVSDYFHLDEFAEIVAAV